MASASIYIPPKIYKDGTTGIFIRIIHNRKIHLKQICKVKAEMVDHKRKQVRGRMAESHQLNSLISKSLADVKEYLIDCMLKKIEPDPVTYFKAGKRGDTLVDHIRARGEEMEKAGGYRNAAKHISTANRIEFLKMNVPVTGITVTWLKRFDAALDRMGNKPNTRAKHMSIISAVIREIDGAVNPFLRFKKPSNKTTKAKLSIEEIAKLEAEPLTGMEAAVRDAFLFAIYARGMRAFDLLTLQWSNLQDGRMKYTSRKTGKEIDLMITEPMSRMVDKFGSNRTDSTYIFPFIKTNYTVYQANEKRYLAIVNRTAWRVNVILKDVVAKCGILKNVSLHVARHTFANQALKAGIDLVAIQNLLDHGKLTTTAQYAQELMHTDDLDKSVEGLF